MSKKQLNQEQPKVLNIGCGPVSRWEPYTEGLDIQDFGQKYVCSVMDFKPPYKYDMVLAHHLVEHIPDTVSLMEKFGSLLKTGGILDIRVPTHPYPQMYVDPTHCKVIPQQAEYFFGYFTKNSMAGHRYTECEYEIVKTERDRFEWEVHVVMKKVA